MIEPIQFSIDENVTAKMLLKNGFMQHDNSYIYKKCLYYFDNTKAPYVTFKMTAFFADGEPYMMYSITRDDGCCYPAFYDTTVRHDNKVYEKIVEEYNKIVSRMIDNEILKRYEEDKNGGNN